MTRQVESRPDAADAGSDSLTCYCPLGGVMDLLSRKYAIQLICVVGALGPVKYGDTEDAFGDVSSSTLSTRPLPGHTWLADHWDAPVPGTLNRRDDPICVPDTTPSSTRTMFAGTSFISPSKISRLTAWVRRRQIPSNASCPERAPAISNREKARS